MMISKVRVNQILNEYKVNSDLFNWCEDYKAFVSDNVQRCVSSEVSYMLAQSYAGDEKSPINYMDLEEAKENSINYKDIKKRIAEKILQEDECVGDYDENEIRLELADKIEIFEYWVISEDLAYLLKTQGEVILEGYWCRQTTGQSVSLDNCLMSAFIEKLELQK